MNGKCRVYLIACSVMLVLFTSTSAAQAGSDAGATSAAESAVDASASAGAATWYQWGGPNRDFKLTASGLAGRWPASGPRKLWSRPLGEGYAAIVADSQNLYTTYRQGNEEVVIAMRADTGETVWEHRYEAEPYADQTAEFGQGPNASPLLLDDRLVTVGFTGIMHCLDVESGKKLWSHDLVKDFGGKIQFYGYSNSPLVYNDTIITLVGGEDCGVAALKPADGSVVWKSPHYDTSYAAPILINVDGQDQVVFFSTNEVIGIDPKNGSRLWSHLVVNFCRTNCTSAVWGEDNLLWAATKGVGGTRVLKLSQQDGKTEVKEIWCNRKIRVYHWNAIRVGDRVYTSSGDRTTFLSVIDVKTGELLERQRGFGSTNGIYADGKLVLLDDGGKLALANISPERIEIVSSVQLFNSRTWTVPSLVGHTLFARDRKEIVALDLGLQVAGQPLK